MPPGSCTVTATARAIAKRAVLPRRRLAVCKSIASWSRAVSSASRPLTPLPRPRPPPFSCRSYHSYDHPPPPSSFSDAEKAILSAAYTHVPSHGFSCEALALGTRDAGYPDISTSILPEGTFSLIRWHLVTRREALAERSREMFGEETLAATSGRDSSRGSVLAVGDKVERLAWERLMGNREIVHRWQEVS